MSVSDAGMEMARRVGYLESMVAWALHPERPRDAEYRLEELRDAWAGYHARFEDESA